MSDPLFDPVAHTQAGLPHLIGYLREKYIAHLDARIARLKDNQRSGSKSFQLTEGATAILAAPATDFIEFAIGFLSEHRVVENFFVDANHGIVLANNDRMVIAPLTDVAGTMQESGAVSVTHGRSQPGNEGVVNTDYRPIR